jgi:hypothetical protein
LSLVPFQFDEDDFNGHGIHGRIRKVITPTSNFSVSFRGFRGYQGMLVLCLTEY